MTQSDPPPPTQSQPLDYGKEQRQTYTWWQRARGWVGDQIDGFFQFLGQMLSLICDNRTIVFGIGVACLAGGLGLCLQQGFHPGGPRWMCVGGFLAGTFFPKRR